MLRDKSIWLLIGSIYDSSWSFGLLVMEIGEVISVQKISDLSTTLTEYLWLQIMFLHDDLIIGNRSIFGSRRKMRSSLEESLATCVESVVAVIGELSSL